MSTIDRFEDLEAWKLARQLTGLVYTCSGAGNFGRDFALRDQIRRASISIVSNIAEGFERDGDKEFVQFPSMAKGSCGEVRAQLYLALDQKLHFGTGVSGPNNEGDPAKSCYQRTHSLSTTIAVLWKEIQSRRDMKYQFATWDLRLGT